MGIISIDVQLSVEVKDQAIFAHLVFTNNTTEQLNLDKYNICLDGKFRNNVFEITDEKGGEASYTGPMLKRKIRPEDFILLKKNEKVKVAVNLNDGYKLIKGRKYFVQYYAFNPGLLKDSPLMEMESNKVSILYQ
jgi:hypothetical protein